MAKTKKGHKGATGASGNPGGGLQKADIGTPLRGHTWPGQKTAQEGHSFRPKRSSMTK